MAKRAFDGEEPQQDSKNSRYSGARSVVRGARAEVGDTAMSMDSKASSAYSSRRSSFSSEGMSPHQGLINAFKGNAFSSARNFVRSGASAPLHPVNYPSSMPLPRPESSSGVTAKVQSLLDGFSQQMDVKIDSKLKPLVLAQEVINAQVTSLDSNFTILGSALSTQLSEQDEKNAQRNKELDERIMRGVKEITDGQSQRISHVSTEIQAAQSSITELTGEQSEICAELSQARKEATAAVVSAKKILTENSDQLRQELETRIDSTVHDAKQEMELRISESSRVLDKKIDSNIEAVQSLSSDINAKVEGMKKDLVSLEDRLEAETGAIKKSLVDHRTTIESSLQELEQSITDGTNFSVETREKMIKALVGLKGHLLANTAELIAYQEDYSEQDKARLEYHLEVEMYKEIRGFVEEASPHFVEVIDELRGVAEENLDRLTNQEVYTNIAANAYDAEQQAHSQQYSGADESESEGGEFTIASSCTVIDLTLLGDNPCTDS